MEEEIKQLLCKACGELKPLTEFYIEKKSKRGRHIICKECFAKKDRQRYLTNRGASLKRAREYYRSHQDQKHAYDLSRYRSNLNQERARARRYRESHRTKRRESNRKYIQTENGKVHKLLAKHCRRARERKSIVDLTPNQWLRILKNQKHRCNLCGKRFTKTQLATLDHIIPLSKGGDLTSTNVQALCRSCNSSKQAKILKGFINSWCL